LPAQGKVHPEHRTTSDSLGAPAGARGDAGRLEQTPDAMRIRRSTVEHPYGTIKAWMGATHFLTKGLEHVMAVMSLHVLTYNFKRLIAILGVANMLNAIRAYAPFF
jgi:transposase